jgi:DNA-binding transcriptional ArsR family regulator
VADTQHRITDPREMRALAHPLRLRLLGLLRVEGPATATTLADIVGESPALVSYHLRQLDTYDFVEEAPELARDGRERWWRAAQASTNWDAADFLDTPERLAALTGLQREVFRRYQTALEEFLHAAPAWGREWVDASEHSDYGAELDAAGLKALTDELDAVIERYAANPPPATGPTENIAVILHAFPRTRSR